MSVSYVGGSVNETAGTTSVSITYSPTSGNTVILGLSLVTSVSSILCQDNNHNILSTPLYSPNSNTYLFNGTAITGATSYAVSWIGTAAAALGIVEYSGVAGIGTGGGIAGTGISGNTAIITNTSTENNSVFVAIFGLSSGVTVSQNQGNLRQQESSGGGGTAVVITDNTGVAIGTSITNSTTMPLCEWWAVSLEIFPNQQALLSNLTPGCNVAWRYR